MCKSCAVAFKKRSIRGSDCYVGIDANPLILSQCSSSMAYSSLRICGDSPGLQNQWAGEPGWWVRFPSTSANQTQILCSFQRFQWSIQRPNVGIIRDRSNPIIKHMFRLDHAMNANPSSNVPSSTDVKRIVKNPPKNIRHWIKKNWIRRKTMIISLPLIRFRNWKTTC